MPKVAGFRVFLIPDYVPIHYFFYRLCGAPKSFIQVIFMGNDYPSGRLSK